MTNRVSKSSKKPRRWRPADEYDSAGDLEGLADRAVHSGDPVFRRAMRAETIRLLESGQPLSDAARVWLLFVLRKLNKDSIPTLAKGRPVDGAAHLLRSGELFLFLDARRDFPLKDALDAAAFELGEWAPKFFYSDDFADWRRLFKADRARRRKLRARNCR
jgi:hypothetical protein